MKPEVEKAIQRVRDAKDANGLDGDEYIQFLEELLADASGWQMELDDLD
jgi:hypothetical protein